MNSKLQLQFLLEQVIPRDIWFQLFMKAVALRRGGHKEKLTVEVLCGFICIPAFREFIRLINHSIDAMRYRTALYEKLQEFD